MLYIMYFMCHVLIAHHPTYHVYLYSPIYSKNIRLEQMKGKMIEMQSAAKQRSLTVESESEERQRLLDLIDHLKGQNSDLQRAKEEGEKTVTELKASNQTLESYKSVLTHDIDQLKAEKTPLTEHIAELKTHIAEVYEELVEEFEIKKADKIVSDKKDKRLSDLSLEVSRVRAEGKRLEQINQSFLR